jgi:predicted RNase H-like HicB family nuclease
LEEVQKAKELWIEAARSEGKPIPPPKYRPIIYQMISA